MTTATEVRHKFITFRPYPDGSWGIYNNRSVMAIGGICWLNSWRQYVFAADEFSEWNHECLTEIAAFLVEQTANRKAAQP